MIGTPFFLYILIFTRSQYEHVEHAPVLYRRRSCPGARPAERPSGPRARPHALAGKGSSRGKFPTAQILPRAQGSGTLSASDVIRLMPRAVASRRPVRDSGYAGTRSRLVSRARLQPDPPIPRQHDQIESVARESGCDDPEHPGTERALFEGPERATQPPRLPWVHVPSGFNQKPRTVKIFVQPHDSSL